MKDGGGMGGSAQRGERLWAFTSAIAWHTRGHSEFGQQPLSGSTSIKTRRCRPPRDTFGHLSCDKVCDDLESGTGLGLGGGDGHGAAGRLRGG